MRYSSPRSVVIGIEDNKYTLYSPPLTYVRISLREGKQNAGAYCDSAANVQKRHNNPAVQDLLSGFNPQIQPYTSHHLRKSLFLRAA